MKFGAYLQEKYQTWKQQTDVSTQATTKENIPVAANSRIDTVPQSPEIASKGTENRTENRANTPVIFPTQMPVAHQDSAATANPNSKKAIPIPVKDAVIRPWITANSMSAFLTVIAPDGGGKDVTYEQLVEALTALKVTTNIDHTLLHQIADEKLYHKGYKVAQGVAPVHGINGTIRDHFSRESKLQLEEDAMGRIDFKSLNLVQEIQEGDVICDMIPPTPETDGLTVTGTKISAKKGKIPRIPSGKNTSISEDGTQLLASVTGHLAFEAERFCVHERLIIYQNVNSSVGNLDFVGDIEIHGDVNSGFSVTSKGNITVHGIVEAATLQASGNIMLLDGMNGDSTGVLKADGDIIARFLENCTAYSYGSIYSESILNSQIYCHGMLSTIKGKGAIISCFINANMLQARTIGTNARNLTKVVLGNPFDQAKEEADKKAALEEIESTLFKMCQNIVYLVGQQELSEQKKAILKSLREQTSIYQSKRKTVKAELDSYLAKPVDLSACCLQAGVLNPPVFVTIGRMTRQIDIAYDSCNIYLSNIDHEITIGTM